MNKKLIALAVAAGMAAPMAANAAPTVYGHLQAEYTSYDNGGNTADQDQIDDNKRGRLGVKGNEDLGNGLQAIYKFEFQVETTEGNVDDGDRNSYVGLKGGFGSVKLGALKSPYKYFGGVKHDAFVTTAMQARDGNGGMYREEGAMSAKFGSHSFLKNSIGYQNKFGNVDVWAVYQMGENATQTTSATDNLVAGVRLNMGAFEVFAATADEDKVGTRTKFGGAWESGPHKIMAQMESQDDDAANGTDVDVSPTATNLADDSDAMYAAYNFTMGANTIALQWGNIDFDRAAANDVDYTAIGVIHKFSKTTRVFAGYRTTDVDGGDASDVDALTAGLRIDF